MCATIACYIIALCILLVDGMLHYRIMYFAAVCYIIALLILQPFNLITDPTVCYIIAYATSSHLIVCYIITFLYFHMMKAFKQLS
jgi:hypothetical protein